MNLQIVALIGLGSLLASCQTATDSTETDPELIPNTEPDANANSERVFSAEEALKNAFRSLPPEERRRLQRLESAIFPELKGNSARRGFASCNDYLTNVESEDFCSSAVPDDWVRFEYDGEFYYFQPLSRLNN